MTMQDYLDEHMGRWSPETLDRYQRVLKNFLAEVETENLTASKLRAWIYSHPWGSSQRYLALMAIKGYIRWLYGEKHPCLVYSEKQTKPPPQRALKPNQIVDLICSFETSTLKGQRDLAICTLMLDTGLRVSEVCRAQQRYLDLDERLLRVIIKGGKWGSAMFSEPTKRYIQNWLSVRPAGEDTIFVSVGGNTPGKRLTRPGLQRVVKTWGEKAGIGLLSPHDLRRTFAVMSTRLGAPSRLVQLAGRWSSIEMVERYTSSLEVADFEKYFPVAGLGF
jgi:integrase